MKKQMFEELLGSVREGGAFLRGERKPSRRIVTAPPVSGPFANEPAFRSRRLRN